MRIDGRGVERDGELVMAVGELASGRKFVGLLGVSGEEGGERALIDIAAPTLYLDPATENVVRNTGARKMAASPVTG